VLFLDHLGPMKRRMLLSRWKTRHQADPSYIKEVAAESSARE
jgi:hypothetical protein